jgi:uncharacterized protein (TIGR02687 family)
MDKISQAITRLFDKHRIVFWYDTKKELRQEYESLWLPGIEKVELSNNEYRVKYLILREKPSQKFLLYHEGQLPDELNNWLLDIQLAQGVFSADQEALWANEVGLPHNLSDLVTLHPEFFKDEQRRLALKTSLKAEDTHDIVRVKMMSICARAEVENRFEGVVESLLAELANEEQEKFNLVQDCNLDSFLWEQLKKQFGYQSQALGIKDFAISLFKACYKLGFEDAAALNHDALVFLKRWRDNVRYRDSFRELSGAYASILGIEKDLQQRDIRTLIDMDLFQLIDLRILSELAGQIYARTISAGECANLIWRRRNTHWYGEFQNIYESLFYASQFIQEVHNADLRMESLADGIRKYQTTWYRLDQIYRKFIFHVRASRQPLLDKLAERIDALYANNYLLTVNDNFQRFVDAAEGWSAAPIVSQSEFFERYIREYLGTKNKVAVIISDGLRYEIGQEFIEKIEQEEGYSAEIESMLSTLPSYTQLGMAALLPNEELTILEDGNVLVDGQPSGGLENRSKILSGAIEKGALALRAEDLLAMNRDKYREVTRGAQVVYVYHNQIDHTGDDKVSEGRVFDVVDKTYEDLIFLLKKLYDSYFSNILITSDHGFIYQNQPIDESEFASLEIQGKTISYRNRRFVLGKGLVKNTSAKFTDTQALGLQGDLEIAIPKSIKRLRLQGSGSRYVHGGAALQEIVIPLIKINKKRDKDTSCVEIDIVASSSSVITSGQIAIAFYQTEPISGKVLPRELRAGIYAKDGTLLSDVHSLNFDLAAENPREREVLVRFVLSRKADEVNNQTVYLKLEEPEPGTSFFKEYRTVPYQLRRSFTTDFDL